MLTRILSIKICELKSFSSQHIPFVAFAILATGFFSCCQEVGPYINLSGNHGSDTLGYVDSSQQKNVLIENFTGASCPNCPQGREIIDALLTDNPGRIVVVEVHEGALSGKVFPSDPNLVVPDGDSLAAYI